MSIRGNASGEYLRRTANLPSSTAFTICFWVKLTIRASQYQFWGLEDATSLASNWALIGFKTNGVFEISNTSGNAAFSSNPTNETWFFGAITCSGTGAGAFKGYWAYLSDSSFKTASTTGISFTSALMSLGNDSYDEYCNAAFGVTKTYNAALSESELWAEMHSVNPVRTANLNSWSIFKSTSDVADFSGNGGTWTTGGTLSSEEISPVVSTYGVPSADARGSSTISLASSEFGVPGIDLYGLPISTWGTTISSVGVPGADAYGLSITSFDSFAGNVPSGEIPGSVVSLCQSSLAGVPPDALSGMPSITFVCTMAGVSSVEGEGIYSSSFSASVADTPGTDQYGIQNASLDQIWNGLPTLDVEGASSVVISYTATGAPNVDLYGLITSMWGTIISSTGVPSNDAYGLIGAQLSAGVGSVPGADAYGLVASLWGVIVYSTGIPSQDAYGLVDSQVPMNVQGVASIDRYGLVDALFAGSLASLYSRHYENGAATSSLSMDVGNIPADDLYGLVLSQWGMWINSVGVAGMDAYGVVRSTVVQGGAPRRFSRSLADWSPLHGIAPKQRRWRKLG